MGDHTIGGGGWDPGSGLIYIYIYDLYVKLYIIYLLNAKYPSLGITAMNFPSRSPHQILADSGQRDRRSMMSLLRPPEADFLYFLATLEMTFLDFNM